MDRPTTQHVPVLLDEVLQGLRVRAGGRWLDGTLGGGGHAEAILRASAPDGRLLGLDRDPAALARAAARLEPFGARAALRHGSFEDLEAHASRAGFPDFDGILLDLGFSSDQVDDAARGLSFRMDGPLDMRLDPGEGPTAADLLNELEPEEIADILWRFGEERRSRAIARAIVAARPLTSTAELAALVERVLGRPRRGGGPRRHPATRTFQALRIAVNDELGALERTLPRAVGRLRPGGRLAVISFHSLEDRIAKLAFRDLAGQTPAPPDLPVPPPPPPAIVRRITRKPIQPSDEERAANPRARSAKLRIVERLQPDQERAA